LRQPDTLSRTAAVSGIRPYTRKVLDTVKYVVIAKTSQSSGDLKLGQRNRWFGYGSSQ